MEDIEIIVGLFTMAFLGAFIGSFGYCISREWSYNKKRLQETQKAKQELDEFLKKYK